jgi:hypothetical protein
MMWWDNVLGSLWCVGDSHLIVDQLATLLFQAPSTVVFMSPQRELGGAPSRSRTPQLTLVAPVDMMWWDNVLGSLWCVGDSHLIVDQLATLLFQAPPTVVFMSPQG